MPGPKMGARSRDFDEELVRRSPTYRKWECLAPGERLRYACREFLKGHGDDEERLMRRIMIARRNNVRDHDALKLARQLQSSSTSLTSTPSQPLENMIVNDNQKQQQHEQEGNDVVKDESAIGAAVPNDEINNNNENDKGKEETKIVINNDDDDNTNDNTNHNNIISRGDGEMEEMISRTTPSGVLLQLQHQHHQEEEQPQRRRRRPTTLISDDVIRMEMDGKLDSSYLVICRRTKIVMYHYHTERFCKYDLYYLTFFVLLF
jgi:hypothetical protein